MLDACLLRHQLSSFKIMDRNIACRKYGFMDRRLAINTKLLSLLLHL